jgi:hypothetical protein
MDEVFCQTISLDCVSQSANMCIELCDSETSFLPVWKRELIRKKRQGKGVGSCNVNSGISHGVFSSRIVHHEQL